MTDLTGEPGVTVTETAVVIGPWTEPTDGSTDDSTEREPGLVRIPMTITLHIDVYVDPSKAP